VPYTNLSPGGYSAGPEIVAALDAARRSYAPYSKSPSGVALRTASGRLYRGSYIENVAFNPSLSPLQTALTAPIAGGEDYSSISTVALVEAEGARISQRPVTEIVLRAIAPSRSAGSLHHPLTQLFQPIFRSSPHNSVVPQR
jgi:homodimeric cytidine deaminase